ncbi:TetR/AcrR family transcriptional regulator [Microbacterium sp. A196]|uniref:TetR/AcrR family transcriptional regulator n=1 Tax=unclassified Microbacterium TaxID=2609290 RepID=UPI003FD2802B
MTGGLRERKRRAARLAMERAAVDLAYEEGVQAVTVERVCDAAMVSRSTFFNYFSSLGQAIFGGALEYDPEATERILAKHSEDLVVAASLIVMESVRGQAEDDLTRRRFALFAREPGVTSSVSWTSGVSRGRLVDVITAWLDAHPSDARLTASDHIAEARLTVGLAIALGDEVQRHGGEEFPIDPKLFKKIRMQLAEVSRLAE